MVEKIKHPAFVRYSEGNSDLSAYIGLIGSKVDELIEAHSKLEAEFKAHRHLRYDSTAPMSKEMEALGAVALPSQYTTPPVEAPDDQL